MVDERARLLDEPATSCLSVSRTVAGDYQLEARTETLRPDKAEAEMNVHSDNTVRTLIHDPVVVEGTLTSMGVEKELCWTMRRVVKVDSLKTLSVDASGVHLIYCTRIISLLLTQCHGGLGT